MSAAPALQAWTRSARRLASGVVAGLLLLAAVKETDRPIHRDRPGEVIDFDEQIASAALQDAGLVAVVYVEPGGQDENGGPPAATDVRAGHAMTLRQSTDKLVRLLDCARDGQGPAETPLDALRPLASVSLMAAEQFARGPWRRRAETAWALALSRLGLEPDLSLGPAQMKVSLARQLLGERFPGQAFTYAQAVQALQDDCLAAGLVARRGAATSLDGTPAAARFWVIDGDRQRPLSLQALMRDYRGGVEPPNYRLGYSGVVQGVFAMLATDLQSGRTPLLVLDTHQPAQRQALYEQHLCLAFPAGSALPRAPAAPARPAASSAPSETSETSTRSAPSAPTENIEFVAYVTRGEAEPAPVAERLLPDRLRQARAAGAFGGLASAQAPPPALSPLACGGLETALAVVARPRGLPDR